MDRLTQVAEMCGMTLLALGGAVLLASPAQEARDVVARRLKR
jgi:hypothetical protein